MIHPKPLAVFSTLNAIISDSNYVSHVSNAALTAMLLLDPADFAGVLWFHPCDQDTAVHANPSIYAPDDLRTRIGTARADKVINSYAPACELIKTWSGSYPLTYMGQVDNTVDAATWTAKAANGTLEGEVDRLTSYIPAGAGLVFDGSGVTASGTTGARILDHYMKTRTVYAEGAAPPGTHLWTRAAPGLTTLQSAKLISSFANYRPTQFIYPNRSAVVDDGASPIAEGSQDQNKDYVSDMIRLVRLSFKITAGFDHLAAWPPSWWSSLMLNGGVTSLATNTGAEYGNDAGTANFGTVLKNSSQALTLRIYNWNQGSITFTTTDPTITGDATLTTPGAGTPTVVANGSFLSFPITLTTSATGSKSAGISITHNGLASPFTFTLTFSVINPVGGRPLRPPLLGRRR